MLKYYLDKTGKVIKSILFPSSEFVDTEPRAGSLNPVTSGGVAGSVSQQSSNFAPNYTKTTYEANSYVMYGGVLYTNPNAIGTAEDWNPSHWTQTTVAEMMANAAPKWTKRTMSVSLTAGQSQDVNVQDHEFVDLTAQRSGGTGTVTVNLHLNGECVVVLDKKFFVSVVTYAGTGDTRTTDTDTGLPDLDKVVQSAITGASGFPADEYDPEEFSTIDVLGDDTNIISNSVPLSNANEETLVVLHYYEGRLVITPVLV